MSSSRIERVSLRASSPTACSQVKNGWVEEREKGDRALLYLVALEARFLRYYFFENVKVICDTSVRLFAERRKVSRNKNCHHLT